MRPFYLEDTYLKEWEAEVIKVDGKFVVLDKSYFYPNSGGQPNDTGKIVTDSEYNVTFAVKADDNISHEVDKEGLKVGDKVKCTLDWDRRYELMKMHTATHVLTAVIHRESGALISGNQLGVDKSRIDFSLEDFDREKIAEFVRITNEELKKNIEIKQYYMDKEEALKIPGIIKLDAVVPPESDELHILEIGDIDKQADGGTHVNNTSEIGQIEIVSLKNKGKGRRRIYFSLKEA